MVAPPVSDSPHSAAQCLLSDLGCRCVVLTLDSSLKMTMPYALVDTSSISRKVYNGESSKYELLFRFAVPRFDQLFDRFGAICRFKTQRCGIDAVTQPGRLGTI
jgi:hypothetical protein